MLRPSFNHHHTPIASLISFRNHSQEETNITKANHINFFEEKCSLKVLTSRTSIGLKRTLDSLPRPSNTSPRSYSPRELENSAKCKQTIKLHKLALERESQAWATFSPQANHTTLSNSRLSEGTSLKRDSGSEKPPKTTQTRAWARISRLSENMTVQNLQKSLNLDSQASNSLRIIPHIDYHLKQVWNHPKDWKTL